jgi:hypothetical protein
MAWGLFGWGSGDRGRTPSDADHRDDNGPPARRSIWANWLARHREKARRRRARAWVPSLESESLEGRAMLAVATLDGDNLKIDFEATGSTSEAVTIASDGTNFTLGGDITGTTSFAVASVNRITLSASGDSTAQQMTFHGGTAFTLSSGLSSTGVDTVTTSHRISAPARRTSLSPRRGTSPFRRALRRQAATSRSTLIAARRPPDHSSG